MSEILLLESPEKSRKQPPIEPYKRDVFELYCLWKSIPAFFKYPPKDKKTKEAPTPQDYCLMMGIEDEEILEIVDIRTMGQFAQRFGVSEACLNDWNKTVKAKESLQEIKKWARALTKNVTMGLYNATIRGGLPQHYQVWFKVVEDWVEKHEVEHNYKGVANISYEIVEHQEENKQETAPSPANPQK